jgi:hypothetical protein
MIEGVDIVIVALLMLGIAWLVLIQVFLIHPRDIPEYLN